MISICAGMYIVSARALAGGDMRALSPRGGSRNSGRGGHRIGKLHKH